MSEKGRLVEEVLSQIIKIIPETEILLIRDLNTFRDSLHNKAPEMRRAADCWVPFLDLLNYYIPYKKDAWHLQINDILLGVQQ